MKKLFCVPVMLMLLFMAGLAIQSQAQEPADYTFLRGPMGPQVCIGSYTPPNSDTVAGVCNGQVMDVVQFNAVSVRQSADRLDQAVQVLASIDDKLAQTNDKLSQTSDKMDRLIEITAAAQATTEKQGQDLDELSDAIEKRFETIPDELLANSSFKKELAKLKEDILKEVEKRYQPRQAPAAKK
ncbi:MAG TPA: hypothetical protein VMB78_05020 [Dissulfurispiraceae bacterium]|nr:hypothetical protein [Dissulfurispiraceae bacterium]